VPKTVSDPSVGLADPPSSSSSALDEVLSRLRAQCTAANYTPVMIASLVQVVSRYPSVWSASLSASPILTSVQPTISIDPSARPFSREHRLNAEKSAALVAILKQLQRVGVIEPCTGARYISPVTVVPKKDPGSWRLVTDMRLLNAALTDYPDAELDLRRLLAGFAGCKFFGSFDLTQAYFQLEFHESALAFSAFNSPIGTFRFRRLIMGLKTSNYWLK
jgi:hypothetical protein